MTVSILVGDVREKLRGLPADSFDCVVTSPPYWGLRDYGTGRWEGGDPACDHRSPTMRDGRDEDRAKLPGSDATNSYQLKLAHRSACGKCGAVKVDQQIGLEATMAEHLAVMVDVFREVRRVLKPTGVLFLNYGDCYATTPNGRSAADTKAKGTDDRTFRDKPFSTIGPIYGEPHAQCYDTDGTEELDSQGRGSSSRNRGGARKGSASTRTSGTDAGRALEQARGPLTQILGSMRSLLDRLPSAGSSDQTELKQFSSAILDQAPAAMHGLELLLAALVSTNSGSSQPRPADSHLSDIASACLSSLRSCEIGARRFAHMLAEPSGTPQHTAGSASPSEELAHHIQCTVACCSLLALWDYVAPQRPPSGKRITSGENRDDVDVAGWGSRDDSVRWRGGGVLKAKDLCMIPNRLAIALQEDGWWVRSEIIWAKPNPMPESIKDRPATAHEKIFLLTKSARYFYAADDVRQGRVSDGEYKTPDGWDTTVGEGGHGSIAKPGRFKGEPVVEKRAKQALIAAASPDPARARRTDGFNDRRDAAEASRRNTFARPGKAGEGEHGQKPQHRADRDDIEYVGSRSLRNWEPAPLHAWIMGTSPFSEAHFATFPPELVERCLTAGCPRGGSVLDPFGGAGTTALVADQMQLDCTIIELNPDYVHIAARRIEADRGALQNALDPLQIDLLQGAA